MIDEKSDEKKCGRKKLNLPVISKEKLRVALIISVSVIVLVLITILLLNRFLFVKPELPTQPQNSFTPSTSAPHTPAPDSPPSTREPVIQYDEGIRPKSSGIRKSDDFYTVLVLGRDTGGGGNTDTILLASYDVTNQRATVMSIPRDTMVNVPWDVKKLNSVYNWYGGGDKGIQKVYQEISQLVGFEPDYRIIVEWEAIGEITDAIGGVYFDVPYNMDYDDPLQDLHIHQEKGYRLLTGDDAMQVIRWRMNNSNSPYGNASVGDFGRIKLQQDFLKAVAEQLLTVENIGNVSKIADVFKNNVTTDLSFQNILWFGRQALLGGLTVDKVNFVTMPLQGAYAWSTSYKIDLSYVCPIGEQLLQLVNDHLSPFSEEFSLADLDIMSVNEDGSVSSSTGIVLDENATYPRSYWNPPSEEDESPPENGDKPSEDTSDKDSAADPDSDSETSAVESPSTGDGDSTDEDTVSSSEHPEDSQSSSNSPLPSNPN